MGAVRRPLIAVAPAFAQRNGGRPAAQQTPPAPDVPAQLDLQTAVRYALDNNFAIRQARERIREQEGLIVEIKSQVLPNASINSLYTYTDRELSSDSAAPDAGTRETDVGVRLDPRYWYAIGRDDALERKLADDVRKQVNAKR